MPDTSSLAITSIPPGGIWRVPGARNPFFTGRRSVLTDLQSRLRSTTDHSNIQAIVGMGGIGKTQVAAEFAWQHRQEYPLIWWLPADDATTLALSYAELAKRLGLPLSQPVSLDAARHLLRRALAERSDWLLIFDNVPSPQAIENYLPLTESSGKQSGHILITSRDADWQGVAAVYPLRPMDREESIAFLIRRARTADDADTVRRVAQALADHPLALEQAGAYVQQRRMSYATYLNRFESHWAELLAEGSGLATPSGEYPDSLAMSLELTFRELEESEPVALALLNLFSFFAGEAIPQWLLDTAATIGAALPMNLLPLVSDIEIRTDALAALRRFSLIDGEQNDIQLHRLVAALARRRLSTIERADLTACCLQIVSRAFAFDSQNPQTWPLCATVLPHALAVAEHAELLGMEIDLAAKMLNLAGRFMMKQDRLPEARETLSRALNLAKKVHGPYHTRLAGMSNDLGRVLQKLGDSVGAREQFEKSLRIEENVYGENDSHAVSVLNNYAMTLHVDGDLPAAREQFERALAAYQDEDGREDHRIAIVRNNLACVLRDSGDTIAARSLFELALDAARIVCGDLHPVVPRIAFNLGMLLRAHNNLLAARDQIELALQADRHNLGPSNPQVARDLAELATIHRALGDESAALHFEEQASVIQSDELVPAVGLPSR